MSRVNLANIPTVDVAACFISIFFVFMLFVVIAALAADSNDDDEC
jgi:hypothetical protein